MNDLTDKPAYLHFNFLQFFSQHFFVIRRQGEEARQIFPTIKEFQLGSHFNKTVHMVPAINRAVHSGTFIIIVLLADPYYILLQPQEY